MYKRKDRKDLLEGVIKRCFGRHEEKEKLDISVQTVSLLVNSSVRRHTGSIRQKSILEKKCTAQMRLESHSLVCVSSI